MKEETDIEMSEPKKASEPAAAASGPAAEPVVEAVVEPVVAESAPAVAESAPAEPATESALSLIHISEPTRP